MIKPISFSLAAFILVVSCRLDNSRPVMTSNKFYEIVVEDSTILGNIKRYSISKSLDRKKTCITLTSMPVAGGRCSFISHLIVHPRVNSNYPNYWFISDGRLVFIYDSIFKVLKDSQKLTYEVDSVIESNAIKLKTHPMISEPTSLRVLEVNDSVQLSKTDFYPLLK